MLATTLTTLEHNNNSNNIKHVPTGAAILLTPNLMAATHFASRAAPTLSILAMTAQNNSAIPQNQSSSLPITTHHYQAHTTHNHPSQSLHLQRPSTSHPAPIRSSTATTLLNTCSASISNIPGAPLPPPAHPLSIQNEPPNHVSQVERIWRAAQEGQCTERARDYLLSYAHAVYSKKPNDPCLLPLLHTLIKLHPKHLPTLLLLSCVYYSQGDFVSSLFHNDQILMLDPEYVEAMSNLGTTKRALGSWAEAEEWWWRAIKLRPTYFDAFENLLGVLCNPQPPPVVHGIHPVQPP